MTAFPNIQKCTTKPWKTTEKVPTESAVLIEKLYNQMNNYANQIQNILK